VFVPHDGSVSGMDGAVLIDGSVGDMTSGARLRAKNYVTDDGAKQFVNWFDRQRNEDCAFKLASDGLFHCLPLSADNSPLSYLDAQCTTPALFLPPATCRTPPAYSVPPSGPGCHATYQVYQAGSAMMPAPQNYYTRTNTGQCNMRPVGTGEVHALTQVDVSMFVAAELVRPSATGRLAGTYLLSEDGASERIGWYDSTTNGPCTAHESNDGTRRCVPEPGATLIPGGYFSDAMCTTLLAYGTDEDCYNGSAYVYESVVNGCDVRTKIDVRNDEFTSPKHMAAMMCVAATLPADGHTYAIGAEVPAATFAGLTTSNSGTGRLQKVVDVADDQVSMQVGGEWFDTMRSETCTFGLAGDGIIRCLPGAQAGNYFDDAGCDTGWLGYVGTTGCIQAVKYVHFLDGACPQGSHVYAHGATVTPSMVYVKAGAVCTQAAKPNGTFFLADPEIDPMMFKSATLMTE
jgi:hypothetical protein